MTDSLAGRDVEGKRGGSAAWSPTVRHRAVAGLALGVAATLALALLTGSRVGSVFLDPDDAMRLVMVRDWLAGQPWGDVSQHRMQPGGTPMHWSRVDDLPVAGIVLLLRAWVGQAMAERVAMLAWPVALVPLVTATAALAAGATWRRTWLAIGAVLSSVVLARYLPGRIDHHALMTTCAFAACATVLLPRSAAWGALAGTATALCLAVGFEDMGVLALLGAAIGTLWVLRGDAERRHAAGYGCSLALCMALAEATFVPDAARLATACDALSGAWPLALGLAGAGLASCALARVGGGRLGRGLAAACVGAAPLAVMGVGGRACAAGPFVGLSRAVVAEWLDRVNEMHDVVTSANGDLASLVAMAGVPLVTAGLCWFAWERGRRPTAHEACYLALTAVAVAVGMRYVRNSGLATAMAAPVAARCLAGRFASANLGPGARTAVAFLLLLPTGMFAKDLLWGGVNRPSEDDAACFGSSSWTGLASLGPGTAMTPIDLGAVTLAETRLGVVGGAYHRAARGLDDVVTFMDGDEAAARAVLDGDGVAYVVWCTRMNEVTLAPKWHPGGMGARLARGDLPPWLVPVDVGPGPVRVARVVGGAAGIP